MTDRITTVDEVIPTPQGAEWLGIIECSNCEYTGQMYSTHEPRDAQLWECQECGVECIHNTILKGKGTGELE